MLQKGVRAREKEAEFTGVEMSEQDVRTVGSSWKTGDEEVSKQEHPELAGREEEMESA